MFTLTEVTTCFTREKVLFRCSHFISNMKRLFGWVALVSGVWVFDNDYQ